MTERSIQLMSAVLFEKYKPKVWSHIRSDGSYEEEVDEEGPKVSIEYEQSCSLRACPDDVCSDSVSVEDNEKVIVYTKYVEMDDLKPSKVGYNIYVYYKSTKKQLSFDIDEKDMTII